MDLDGSQKSQTEPKGRNRVQMECYNSLKRENMGKNRKWQFLCILAVTLLTVYNIIPTLFFYSKALHSPVSKEQSVGIVNDIQNRVNHLEKETVDWLESYCKLIDVAPSKIVLNPENPQWVSVQFSKAEHANRLRSLLPRAGALIPFAPAKLSVSAIDGNPNSVLVQRQIPCHLNPDAGLFSWNSKNSPEYKKIIIDRAAQIVHALIDNGPATKALQAMLTQEHQYSFGDKNPIFSKLSIDFAEEKIHLTVHENLALKKEKELLVKEVAKIIHQCNEKVHQSDVGYEIAFHALPNTSGSLALHLDKLADIELRGLVSTLKTKWKPQHPDLQNITIVDPETYANLPIEEKALCIVLYSPLKSEVSGDNGSLYIVAKGFERIARAYQEFTDSPLASALNSDVHSLHSLLYHLGFSRTQITKESTVPFAGDFQFEKPGFATPILNATREAFLSLGSKRYALLDLSNKEQRIGTENKIETAIHEELIKWKDDYLSAQVSLNPKTRFDTPKPRRNVVWDNFLLTFRKMIRGDASKIIRWGLDLSGGKTVEIELRDSNHNVVQEDADLKQGISELRTRVNKMGLSEVSIRQVGQHIVLDFPGSQSLTASELIKASTMAFHVVNEKFSPHSPLLGEATNRFLQNVWDEAVFTGKTDAQGVNEIARKHLYGSAEATTVSEDAKKLRENGFQLLRGTDHSSYYTLDDSISKILVQRGTSPLEWNGLTHPLIVTFNNYALAGSDLENIHSSYDPSKGNYLSFSVASFNKEGSQISPQNSFYSWTSRYSKENVIGTPYEAYSQGRGWRMAVVLNDTVINSPTLDSALKEHAMISGSFSHNEVQHLCADLKAGSLTFTPHILSEKNVSPELGSTDRAKGILATVAALILVIICMIAYYRFAGVVASIAVVFNLLILWAVLQNLGATLTLAGIAGIILTVGMSIDANVLVFERIKEEFALTGKIQSAIQTGYSKAFSAIIDSNITTIIAALILLNFDAGPIKSFAMNLIIGIVSSMFTALFMTRFYLTGWAQNPKNTFLTMSNWMRKTSFDFLKYTKASYGLAILIIVSGSCILLSKSSSILGLDFTGGYSLYLEVEQSPNTQYAQKVKQAFLNAGADSHDFVVQEMNPAHQLRIFFGQSMEQKGKPFYALAASEESPEGFYLYQKNPKISWLVNTLQDSGISLSKNTLSKLHLNWTAVSGQMSDTMRNNALFGFLLSFVGIFVYLCFRFEYKFAAAAIACLIHDVFITLAIMGLLYFFGVPIQLDLITIAALMTAVGYSLNDTIIIFDRIREEMHLNSKRSLRNTVNHALNFTLSRTMITSGTTLLVLLALLILGGASIFGFALVMTIGVVFGTLSSWFIAAPLMLFFHNREERTLIVEKM